MNRMIRVVWLCGLLALVFGPLGIGCGDTVGDYCSVNKDCPSNGVCVQGADGKNTCQPQAPGLVCANDNGCKKTELCLNGRCQVVPGCVCRVDTDCAAGQKCSGCKCTNGPSGTCQTNDQCGAAAQCLNGTCIPKPKCTNDSQCNLDEICQSNVCQPGQACSADADCPADRICRLSRCTRKPLVGCQSDFDCQKPTPICNAATGACVTCRQDSECPAGETCVNGACKAPPCGCQSDADCPPNNLCNQCSCIPVGQKGGAGTKCSQASDCDAGHLCLRTSTGESYCFQDCTQSPRACSTNRDGRNTCYEVSRDQQGNPISLCLKVLKDGEKCGDTGATQSICDFNQSLSCRPDTSTCGKQGAVVRKKAGESCDGQAVVCDRSLNLFCDSQSRTCKVASGLAKEGEVCDPQGGQGNPIPCEDGFTCIQFDQTGNNRCIKVCDPKQADSCSHNKALQCLPILSGGQGLCLNYCKSPADCAFKGYLCRDIQAQQKICFPPAPAGPVPYAGICSSPVATKGCNTDPTKGGDSEFFCLAAQQGADGYCSRSCDTDNKCPDYTNKAGTKIVSNCVAIGQNGSKACLFSCGQPGQICPDGLTCQSVGGGQQLCLAP